MRVKVDSDRCTSNAICMGIAPEVFEIRDDGFLYVLDEDPGADLEDDLLDAVVSCPNHAISVEG
jgi:ferredoxin